MLTHLIIPNSTDSANTEPAVFNPANYRFPYPCPFATGKA